MQYVRGNFFAREHFAGLADAQARAGAWCGQVAGLRVHGTIAARPAEVFAEFEAAALLPAPDGLYDVPVFARVKVHQDFHVEVGRALSGAEGVPGLPPGCPRRLGAGQAVLPQAAGQGPSPPAAWLRQ